MTKKGLAMADRGDGIYTELKDFLQEVKCPGCGALMHLAPVWDLVLRKGYSNCGSCGRLFSLRAGSQMEGLIISPEDLEPVADDLETARAGDYLWDEKKVDGSRQDAVDFFISVGLTAFFDGMERSYPVLQQADFDLAWKYLAQAGAFAVEEVDTRLVADAFAKAEKYKPNPWRD
jgi:hypothetical protein